MVHHSSVALLSELPPPPPLLPLKAEAVRSASTHTPVSVIHTLCLNGMILRCEVTQTRTKLTPTRPGSPPPALPPPPREPRRRVTRGSPRVYTRVLDTAQHASRAAALPEDDSTLPSSLLLLLSPSRPPPPLSIPPVSSSPRDQTSLFFFFFFLCFSSSILLQHVSQHHYPGCSFLSILSLASCVTTSCFGQLITSKKKSFNWLLEYFWWSCLKGH